MTPQYDVAVIGGGIVGLAHALMASRRGLKVILFERSSKAQGASVRNFGMIWPIGQPAGELYEVAMKSRDYWIMLGKAGVLEVEECGSIHLAHHQDELDLLSEFCEQGTHECVMISAEEVLKRSPLANPTGLLGGMFSPTELRVNPRVASAQIVDWLVKTQGVEACFETQITSINDKTIQSADGKRWKADQIIVCSGSDLQTLYSEILENSGLKLCKLQMLKSVAQPEIKSGAPHLASGLTLRHYSSFETCPSLEKLKRRIATESPELDTFGIHVMTSTFPNGETILGDSHEYGDAITPFDKSEIDELMLRELRKVFQLQDWTIQERWHGIYAKHPSLPVFEAQAEDGVQIFVGPGGAGMTMSFGLADRAWNTWTGEIK
ncbi:TIGR03364 family FAD-dependent oxidoreductase [Thalassoglobus sp.]|uniref:TIGR03364 family FAD-dependent oxidoreductase n=1 Tax=Thalassoglobus sp. TaxID=2795869 RepID=UPI003AA7D3D2